MRSLTVRFILVLTTVSLGLLAGGCHHKVPEPPPLTQQSFTHLPDATNVTSALEQKDYQGAVAGLAKVKASITSMEEQQEYGSLAAETRDKIAEASSSDPKAAEALQALNFLISGR